MAPIPDPIRRDASTPQKWDDQCGPERYPRETDADNVIAPEEGVLSTRIDPEERVAAGQPAHRSEAPEHGPRFLAPCGERHFPRDQPVICGPSFPCCLSPGSLTTSPSTTVWSGRPARAAFNEDDTCELTLRIPTPSPMWLTP